MDSVYVIGHRNPDTDSIVSAMAYAALQNALGGDHYIAARYGHLNTETQFLLDRFGFQPPVWLKPWHFQEDRSVPFHQLCALCMNWSHQAHCC